MKIRRALGIDLGTTNSAVALFAPDEQEILLYEDKFRRKTMPSMVGYDPSSEAVITGFEAWHRRAMDPAPIASVKRKMGRREPVRTGPLEFLPEEASAKILERLVEDIKTFVENRHNEDELFFVLDEAVITVPAYFDAPQIEATRKAGERAGLKVVGLLQEPTAAAMYYAWKHHIGDGNFLVYDLGGGTFDVSVIRSMLGEYQVLGIHGDNYLGGDDFDRRLAEHFRKHLVAQGYALDLDIASDSDDALRFLLLTRLAQEVKEALTTSEFQYVARRDIFEDKNGQSVTLELELSRGQFEELIEDLVDQTIACAMEALEHSAETGDVALGDIDYVLLVGGSTRVPLVQKKIAEKLCGPDKSRATAPLLDEPDTCVALGAAIHAGNVAPIEIFSEEGPARVALHSPLSTSSPTARLSGRLLPGHALDGGAIQTAALVNPSGDITALVRAEVDEHGVSFLFDEIPTAEVGRYDFRLELCDREGDARVAFPLWLRRIPRETALRPTGSALSNPSVLAKDIYLDVLRDGRQGRTLLLARGTSLPASGHFKFYTTDHCGAVLLRLFQNRFPIRTIHLEIPNETAIGTPVELSLEVDETMTVVASGEVLGQTFWAQIEPPPMQEVKSWTEIEALLDRSEAIGKTLWGQESRIFERAVGPLVAGIRETVRTDPDKLHVLVGRLEDILAEFHQRDSELTPGYGRMSTLLDAIRRLAYRSDETRLLGLSNAEWEAKINAMQTEADDAFEARDQSRWTRVFNRVQATWESLAQDEYRFRTTHTEEHIRSLYAALTLTVRELESDMESFVVAANPETAAMQLEHLRALKNKFKDSVVTPFGRLEPLAMPPERAKPELERLFEATQHIRQQFNKLPTLGWVRS